MSVQSDYFGLFGLPRRYEIDREALDAAYERLSLEYHPDFFTTAGEAEKREAERVSAALNEGYRVLGDDSARAAYLLGLLAGERELDTQELPPGFLQDVFGLQEEVDALRDGADPGRREALRADADGRLARLREERARLFAEAMDTDDPSLLQAIQSNLNRERYLQRLLERLEGSAPEL